MLKVYYCSNCNRISYIAQDSRATCKSCDAKMSLIKVPYSIFALLDESKRKEVIKTVWKENWTYLNISRLLTNILFSYSDITLDALLLWITPATTEQLTKVKSPIIHTIVVLVKKPAKAMLLPSAHSFIAWTDACTTE